MTASRYPIVVCPGCQIEMVVHAARGDDGSDAFEHVTYRCQRCGMETTRLSKQQNGRAVRRATWQYVNKRPSNSNNKLIK